MKKKAFIALTGASGTIYGVQIIKTLQAKGFELHITSTKDALTNANIEYNCKYKTMKEFLRSENISNINYYGEEESIAPPASGSYNIDYYIIAPASMGFIGRIANGVSLNLPERAADVALKERKPLAILFREMPLSSIHLENMLKISNCGGIILPASPGFYHQPKDINGIIDFTIGKCFDSLNITHNLYKRWGNK